jgi:hypothetical protein
MRSAMLTWDDEAPEPPRRIERPAPVIIVTAPPPAVPHACYFVSRLGVLVCEEPGCRRVVTAEDR